jgi:hypothetical protein
MSRREKEDQELCQRCGFPVPPRLRDTGFCTKRCMRDQARADEDSMESELAEMELSE